MPGPGPAWPVLAPTTIACDDPLRSTTGRSVLAAQEGSGIVPGRSEPEERTSGPVAVHVGVVMISLALFGKLRAKLSGRREQRAKKAHAEAEIKRQ